MLDTNTVSHIVKGRSIAARSRLASLPIDAVVISSITEAELQYGLAKLPAEHPLRGAMHGFFSRQSVLSWGSREADTYGQLRAMLERNGKSLDTMDMLIAAHAAAAELILVTGDKALLTLNLPAPRENWATDLP